MSPFNRLLRMPFEECGYFQNYRYQIVGNIFSGHNSICNALSLTFWSYSYKAMTSLLENDSHIFTALLYCAGSNTFNVSAGVTSVYVVVVGGGAGGAFKNFGGGAGGYVLCGNFSVVPNTSYTVVVGSGGIGGTASLNTSSPGGNSSFGNLLTAMGGDGCSFSSTAYIFYYWQYLCFIIEQYLCFL